jgi:hypothetical protein
MEQNVKIILSAKDETGAAVASAEGGLGRLTSTASKFAIAAGAAFAVKKVVDFGISAVQSFSEAEYAIDRLTQIVKTSTHASDEQVKALVDQADALERVGVVSSEAILMGQGQLASFDLQAASIQKLIPSILNYAVAERGANMAGEDLKQVTNGLAQALQGNFASLTKTGFIIDDATKKLISEGTETERVAALVKVLDSTYAGLNETMRQGTEGQMIGLSFAMDNLKKQIGATLTEALQPFIVQLTAWVNDPKAMAFVKALAQVIAGTLTAAIWMLNNAIEIMIAFFEECIAWGDKLVAMFNAVVSAAVKVKNTVSSVISSAASKVGLRAEGGPVNPGGAYIVGEQGPELFRPKVSGEIIPNGRGGGGSVVINITGNTLLDMFAAEKIGDLIMSRLKLSTRI